jgi:riboflavin kinase
MSSTTTQQEPAPFQGDGSASNNNNTNHDDIQALLPIRIISKVVRGFGRGSSDLGIPTANLCRESARYSHGLDLEALPCGIYWGFARIVDHTQDDETPTLYKAAISIGYNPTYGNTVKTIEPHLIATPTDSRRHVSSCGETVLRDFYDDDIRLSVVGYLRPELPFEGLESLVRAIKQDIANTEQLCDGSDVVTLQERLWVTSKENVV